MEMHSGLLLVSAFSTADQQVPVFYLSLLFQPQINKYYKRNAYKILALSKCHDNLMEGHEILKQHLHKKLL